MDGDEDIKDAKETMTIIAHMTPNMPSKFEDRLFIAGNFVEGSGVKLDVVNPATKETVVSVHVAGVKEVDAAVDAAEKAWPAWANGDPSIRAKALNKLAELIQENAKELAMAQTVEMGRVSHESVFEIHMAAEVFRYFAGLADKVHGKTSLNVPGFLSLEVRQPYGVTAGILPWNGPILMLAWKVAPALAVGNASIIKTSEKSPLSGLVFASLAKQSGIPDGVLNILTGGPETGKLLASHMRIRKIAFTGSAIAGRAVMKAAAASNLKSCTLELGGKSPVIVFDDCNLDDTLARVQGGFTYNNGQVCIAGTRIYVQDTIFDEFAKRLASGLQTIKSGDPTDATSTSGPQADVLQYNRIIKYLEKGKEEGGKVLIGGSGSDEKGYFIKPTVFTDVKDDAVINQEEIFGPVSILHKFTTEEEVLRRANNTEYGLAAYIFTKDVSRAIRFAKSLEAGAIGVNTSAMSHPDLAFGGWKGSGIGRELGHHAIDNYTEVKTIFIR